MLHRIARFDGMRMQNSGFRTDGKIPIQGIGAPESQIFRAHVS